MLDQRSTLTACIGGTRGVRRRVAVLVLTLIALLLAAPSAPAVEQELGTGESPGRHWVGTWTASPLLPAATGLSSTGFTNQTVRQILHTSVGGNRVRLRLSNTFGTGPLKIDEVALALPVGSGRIEPSTSRELTFGGAASVTIPRGARVLSDPVSLRARPDSDVAVSLYVAGSTGPTTWHSTARQTTWVSTEGNHVDDATADAFSTTATSFFLVDGLEVEAPGRVGAVVTVGDSITDGTASTLDANRRYPNFLARRLLTLSRGQRTAVLNAGISGNRVLSDTATHFNVLARFDRDVIAQAGVRDVILLEGINDIGSSERTVPINAAELIFGYQQLILQAHAKGLRILGGTLLPYEGAGYYGPVGEATRQAVNEWIRSRSGFDGVVDFDAVMRDPDNPLRLLPAYDSGDHLHPSDAGYAAMGAAVRLRCLTLGGELPRLTGAREDCTITDGGA